jgi:hypothetical protein
LTKQPTRVDPVELIRNALTGLRSGEVVIAVHDGEIVQIARTEKSRTQRFGRAG